MDQLIDRLRSIVGTDAILSSPDELLVYECDGLPQHKYLPRAVVFPSSTEEVSAIMRLLASEGVPFTPRGAGTGLSGGALALQQGVVVELARMREILSIDPEKRIAVVQPGVVNLHVSQAAARFGLHYVPDPSSQPTCTIGGNIAENAGGIHCLKYGTTTDHVLAARVVLAGGSIVDLVSGERDLSGYDLLGVFIGSEGTFGIATEATLRLVPIPSAVRTLLAEFVEVNDASHAVSAIIAAGVMPAALEMMDQEIIRAVEASLFAAGLPVDIGAALLIELDGLEAGIDQEAERVKHICLEHGARSCRLARDENERKKLWAARKGAFGAIGRIAPDSMIQDAVVPRSRLPEILADAYHIATKYQLRLANVFHAGDGNLHPLICFDSRSPDEVRRVREAGRELMETCVRAGGSITGEHGVGLDKRELLPLVFSDDDMETMLQVRAAFDPLGLCNPGKIIPVLRGCGEGRAVATDRLSAQASAESQGALASYPTQQFRASLNKTENGGERQRPSPRPAHFSSEGARKRLESIVWSENITMSRWPGLHAEEVMNVAPASAAEVRELMALAASEGWAVLPAGGGTWLTAGNPLDKVHLIISTGRLNQIRQHEPADLIATAQAGVTLNSFNEVLAQKGQWVPLDPPDDGRSTIGGMVATGLAGPQQCGYGPPRRHVIGMRVVLADGKEIRAGGLVVKNVAGYDLCKLFTGSYGTLGIITELTFKLRPVPAKTATVIALGSLDSLVSGGLSVRDARLSPVAMEMLSPPLSYELELVHELEHHLMLIRFAGSPESVDYQVQQAAELVTVKGAVKAGPLDEEDSWLWRKLAAVPLLYENHLLCRTNVPATLLVQFSNSLASFSRPLWQASLSEGRLRFIHAASAHPRDEIRTVEVLRNEAQKLGAPLVIENAANDTRNAIDCWGGWGSVAPLMARIKQQLDPRGLLSPGRFRFETGDSFN